MIILASTSPRRREIMSKYFTEYKCISPNIDENDFTTKGINDYAFTLSKMKAYSVYKTNKNDLIVSCDTIVVYNDRIFEKPKSRLDAFNILKNLSGNKHFVLSAYTILYKDIEITRTVKTTINFKKLSDKQINDYLDENTYMDKAGAYAIQDKKNRFVESINGSFYNVMGFPIEQILKDFAKLGYFPNKES